MSVAVPLCKTNQSEIDSGGLLGCVHLGKWRYRDDGAFGDPGRSTAQKRNRADVPAPARGRVLLNWGVGVMGRKVTGARGSAPENTKKHADK